MKCIVQPEDNTAEEIGYNDSEHLISQNQVNSKGNQLLFDDNHSDDNINGSQMPNSSTVDSSSESVTCINCKKKCRQIYRHIMINKE